MLLPGEKGQFVAELRRGDSDEGLHPLADRFAVEVGDAVLGDDVARVVARGDDACAPLVQHGLVHGGGGVHVGGGPLPSNWTINGRGIASGPIR